MAGVLNYPLLHSLTPSSSSSSSTLTIQMDRRTRSASAHAHRFLLQPNSVQAIIETNPKTVNLLPVNACRKEIINIHGIRRPKQNQELTNENDIDQQGLRGNSHSYAYLLHGCVNTRAFSEGKSVHAHIIKTGYESDKYLADILITMYARYGILEDARQMFEKMPQRGRSSWTALIVGCAQNVHSEGTLQFLCEMHMAGVSLNGFVITSALSVSAQLRGLAQGKMIHALILKIGLESDIFVGSALVTMYFKCKSISDARMVFDRLSERDVHSWNAMIAGYTQNKKFEEAVNIFSQMQSEGKQLDKFTLTNVLSACSSLIALEQGKQVHVHILKVGFELNVSVGNALVDMYAKCDCTEEAHRVFEEMPKQDIVTWTTIITCNAQNGDGNRALRLFCQMQLSGIKPNQFTLGSVLQACATTGNIEHGKQTHGQILKFGFDTDVFVGSALVDMYAKCRSIYNARKKFDRMDEPNVISWNGMIVGYAQNGLGEEAIRMFSQMKRAGIKPNSFTFASILSASAFLASLEQGKELHTHIIKTGYESDISVGNSLITMYAKCGSIGKARNVFDRLLKHNTISWNSMISGYAQHGQGKEAVQLFEQMQLEGMKPDQLTYTGILSACSHAGLVDEGCCFFESMYQDHGITPKIEQYACMVDLFGRAGHLDEAEFFIKQIPFEPDALVWRTLLGACRVHGDINLGKVAAESILKLEPENAAAYVLLANIFAVNGMWDDVGKVRELMKSRGVKKEVGCSWIEIKENIHTFMAKDKSHPQTKEIYAKLGELTSQIKEAGYVPDTNFVLHDIEEEQKENSLSYHSEKLALAFGLISTASKSTIIIFKNLRVCGDCHSFFKFTSNIVQEEIVVRDANRFHHFKKGMCSCRDYW